MDDALDAEVRRLEHMATIVVEAMPGIINALMDDLGESPEAMRGARCITSTARGILASILNRDIDERAWEMEAQVAGLVLAVLCRSADVRLDEVMPDH
jgi:hypothetical protein